FAALMDGCARVLEIGPLASPLLRRPGVQYFDVLSTADLREKARIHGLDVEACPTIDFVSATGDLAVVTQTFDAVVSCHVIEHQPDLVRHLRGVADIMKPGGRYFLAVPDKRYCFDHFIAASTIADVIDAHAREARTHSIASIIEHTSLTTHNDTARHWNGDHGEPRYVAEPGRVQGAVDAYLRNPGAYIDAHAWQFVPSSFRDIMGLLRTLRVSAFEVERVYPTVRNSNEFYAVLKKVTDDVEPLQGQLPPSFNAQEYLLANPDVARAGVDPAEHYLAYGRREGRQLRRSR
ncbi:MAG TPA: methyltransferase domain-containing protein, partial [Rudaea sp.]